MGGISPLTGFWGEATSGGKFPFRLKGSGWDGLLVKGKADKPSYLFLKEGKAEIRDASHLWGKDSYQTQKTIKDELDDDSVSIACIGTAGEKLIKYAAIMNDSGRAAGRCGLGALMGSKNLKAVAASGNLRPELSNPEKIRELAKQAVAQINGNLVSVAFREYGTMMYMDMAMTLGDAPGQILHQGRLSCFQGYRPGPSPDLHRPELRLPGLPHRMRSGTSGVQTGA